eukprot:363759-Chlamydomonas_euryale.AAC.24
MHYACMVDVLPPSRLMGWLHQVQKQGIGPPAAEKWLPLGQDQALVHAMPGPAQHMPHSLMNDQL